MRVLVAVMAATALAGVADAERVTTRDYTFEYSYPREAAAIAPLRAWLEADRARLRRVTARDAAAARRESADATFPFHAYDTQKTWKVVTSTPRFLSLSFDRYRFTGGAHGNPSSGALLWDKMRRARLDPMRVFTSEAALERIIAPRYCARLKAERSQRLTPNITTGGMFDKCPPLGDLTLLLGSSDRQRIDRVGLIADPYVAGSYAEGAYEVTLPVTRAIVATVKPEYRAAFAAR
ncbi:DUF4163 domain-containing protein [Sphingomonas sp.]|uniref:DUF4163 domain-containing protein n=1 Tax=Sphingomonas sp. TaxID=28214 RepID=UPI0035C7C7EF